MKYAQDLKRVLTPYSHFGTASGHGVAQPLMPTVCGVADVFSPPYFVRSLRFRIDLEVDGHRVHDTGDLGKGDCGLLYSGGTWQIDRLVREGTYHHRIDGRLISIGIRSELFALRDRAGFALRVRVQNRCGRAVSVVARPEIESACPGRVALSSWDYTAPRSGNQAHRAGPGHWSNGEADLLLIHDERPRNLAEQATAEFDLALIVSAAGQEPVPPPAVSEMIQQTIDAWRRRLQRVDTRLPSLSTDIPGLEAYYNRSIASGLVCLWDRPDFACDPYVATSGMDGGAICCYPWDTAGYAPHTLALLVGDRLGGLVEAMSAFGLDRHSRFAPDGRGLNVPYAYNTFAYISLIWSTCVHNGIDRGCFERAAKTFLDIESRLNVRDHLADYGYQHNLLEMRQSGYEHYVASPNAERAWCYRRLADLGERLGNPRVGAWRQRAEQIIAAVRQKLWCEDAGFFKCVHADGADEVVLSVQGFDAMRAGACTPRMARAMLRRVRDGAFLGEYGVSSMSAEDALHYELNDPDWSGGGAFSGDGPLLALTLWEQGEPELGWDVLRRFFWMGRHLLYFPQEHYCDRPMVPAHKRSNVIAGLAGAEAVLFGLAGVRLGLDGDLVVEPGWPSGLRGTLQLSGLRFRQRSYDVLIEDGRASVRELADEDDDRAAALSTAAT